MAATQAQRHLKGALAQAYSFDLTPHHGYETYPLHEARSHSPAISTANSTEPFQKHKSPLGIPTTQKTINRWHAFAVVASLICLALSLATVASEQLSWQLGRNNHQLIVLGFLLSIMCICLASVAPHLFLVIEARFGSSTLQNFEGILQNRPCSPRLSFIWRLILVLNIALPLALSVAYKTFIGGESQSEVNARNYILLGDPQTFGLFALPGLQLIGAGTGITIFSNATLDFSVTGSAPRPNATEPLPPLSPNTTGHYSRAYGYNILSLTNTSSAFLDIPSPNYIRAIQSLLQGTEAWDLRAPVTGTVATQDTSNSTDPDSFQATFLDICDQAAQSSGAKTHMTSEKGWSLNLIDRPNPGDSTRQYLAVAPDPGFEHSPSCDDLAPYAEAWDVTRRNCEGLWRITRSGVQLLTGFCKDDIPDKQKQLVITDSSLFLGLAYMPSLVELLGTFNPNGTRAESKWRGQYFSTAVAGMVWSRLISAKGSEKVDAVPFQQGREDGITAAQAGIFYSVGDKVVYSRPTMRKDVLLYLVLAVQPLLTLLAVALLAIWRATPVGKHFGLVSILAGIEPADLGILAGAALSGQLRRDVRVGMWTEERTKGEAEGKNLQFEFHEIVKGQKARRGRLDEGTLYH